MSRPSSSESLRRSLLPPQDTLSRSHSRSPSNDARGSSIQTSGRRWGDSGMRGEEYELVDEDGGEEDGKASEDDSFDNPSHPTPHSQPLLFHGLGSPSGHQRDPSREFQMGEIDLGAKSSLWAAVANMSNSIIGAGIIGLPYAVSEAGFFTGIFLLVALCAVTDWTIRLIIISGKLCGQSTYMGVMDHCFGYPGRLAVSFFQFSFALGGMCANGVIIGDTIPSVLTTLFPTLHTIPILSLLVNRQFAIVLFAVAVMYPLSLNKDIAKLSRASSMALVAMGVIVLSVMIRGPLVDQELKGSREGVYTVMRPKVFEAIGVISFAYVCQHNSTLLYHSLRTPTLKRFSLVVHVSMTLSLIACLCMSLSGYLVFTDKTQANVLNNFPKTDMWIALARFMFASNMSTTFPLELFVCREVFEDVFFEDQGFNWKRHFLITTALTAFATGVALTTCDLGVVLEITGGLSATALAYIFPASMYFKLISGPWYSARKLPAACCTAFGLVVLVLSVGLTVKKALSGEGGGKVCQ